MSQHLLDCEQDLCTLSPYSAPPATIEHYTLGPEWALFLVGVLILAFIVATTIVRYKAHAERGETERQRILHPLQKCPTCGDELETEET